MGRSSFLSSNKFFFAQCVDSSGLIIWDSSGIEFHSTSDDPYFEGPARYVYSDMRGGAILLWEELGTGFNILLKQISKNGIIGEVDSTIDIIDDKSFTEKKSFQLYQNSPNPFNPSTQIRFELAANSNAELTIYNILGQKIRTLMSGYQSAGMKTVTWDGKSDQGMMVTSGVYIYRLNTSHGTKTRKMILIK